jgi:ankyrin repeat protein
MIAMLTEWDDSNDRINARDKYGNTTLMLACRSGRLRIVKYMLQHHAGSTDMSACNNQGLRAQEIAIQYSHMSIAALLDSYEPQSSRVSFCSIS